MGKPKFSRKKFETPSHPWQEERIKEEDELVRKHGLKNKKEVRKAKTKLRKYRSEARRLLARVGSEDPQTKKESNQLLMHLTRMNILPPNSDLDDVLALNIEKVLSRRLQTITYLKGLAHTPKQARQFIVHGHITVDGKKVTIPGYMVSKKEEGNIGFAGNSPLDSTMHPERPQPEPAVPGVKKTTKPPKKEEEEETGKKDEDKKTKKEKTKEKQKEGKTEEKTEEKKKSRDKKEENVEKKKTEKKTKKSKTSSGKDKQKKAEETKEE
ncbi:MAG: 30S ribosomal protein S4, partial [Candidatus Thermoplasmatota archaeon]